MDNYDKTRSVLGNSVATPEAGLAHASGLEEHPTCDSDVYLGYLQAPTREIINAIEGAGLTRNGTQLNQLFLAIQAMIAAAPTFANITFIADNVIENETPVTSPKAFATIDLASFGVPGTAKVAWVTFIMYEPDTTGGSSAILTIRHPETSGVSNRVLGSGREDSYGCNTFMIDVSTSRQFEWKLDTEVAGGTANFEIYIATVAFA